MINDKILHNAIVLSVFALVVSLGCHTKGPSKLLVIEPPVDPPLSNYQWEVVLDASLLKGPSPNAEKLAEVKRGEYVRVLEIRDSNTIGTNDETIQLTWYKIFTEASGFIGWVNRDAISMMKHSSSWSSDTKDGDEWAHRLFLDKLFFDKPLKHVRVWTRYNLVVLWFDRAVLMDQKLAGDTLRTLDAERKKACEASAGYDAWLSSCTDTWAHNGRWVIIGWDTKGLYRLTLPFGRGDIEPF